MLADGFGPAVPVFRVHDFAESLAYYCQTLGFEIEWQEATRSAYISRGACTILLTVDDQSQSGMWVRAEANNVNVLFEEYLVAGAKIAKSPTDFGSSLEMQIEDLDGNILSLWEIRAEP